MTSITKYTNLLNPGVSEDELGENVANRIFDNSEAIGRGIAKQLGIPDSSTVFDDEPIVLGFGSDIYKVTITVEKV